MSKSYKRPKYESDDNYKAWKRQKQKEREERDRSHEYEDYYDFTDDFYDMKSRGI